ncbi:general substrate transporter [Aspergillus nidulans var. acristatus]
MPILPHLTVNTYNLTVVILVAIGTISTAYGLAVIGSTVGQPSFYTFFDLKPDTTDPDYKHTTNMIGALNGINSAGAFMGCIMQAWSSDVYGRKTTICLGAAVLIIGGALCAGAVHMAMFLVGRFVAGLGAGILACSVPIYQAEVSTAETRGAMVCVTGVMYAVGYSLAGWLGYACWFMEATSPAAQFAWRFPLAFQVLFPLCVLVGAPFIPESPRWLLANGKGGEALSVLQKLHSTNGYSNGDSTKAREEFSLMEKQLELDQSRIEKPRWPALTLFSSPANRKRSLIATILMIGNQFLGTFVLTNYGVLIYASLGLTRSIPLLLNACWTSFTLIGNTWTALYIDRFGRRRFLLAGATGCTLCMVFLCALTASFLNTDNTPGLRATVFFIFFYIFWWCFFVDATQFAYIAEIFPNHLRSQGVALGLGWFYLSSEVTLVAAPVGLDRVGWRFYLVLIVPSVLYIGCIYFLFPETKGRTLEEMGRVFGEEPVYSQEAAESDIVTEKEVETQRIKYVCTV